MRADAPERKNAPARKPDGQAEAATSGPLRDAPEGAAEDASAARSACREWRRLRKDPPWDGAHDSALALLSSLLAGSRAQTDATRLVSVLSAGFFAIAHGNR